jgi:hypothetical protein
LAKEYRQRDDECAFQKTVPVLRPEEMVYQVISVGSHLDLLYRVMELEPPEPAEDYCMSALRIA